MGVPPKWQGTLEAHVMGETRIVPRGRRTYPMAKKKSQQEPPPQSDGGSFTLSLFLLFPQAKRVSAEHLRVFEPKRAETRV